MIVKIKNKKSAAPSGVADSSVLSRKTIRYWLFRFATEANGGEKAVEAPTGLKEYFEGLTWFQGWKSFGITWDVVNDRPLEIKPLRVGLIEAWDKEAEDLAKELPVG